MTKISMKNSKCAMSKQKKKDGRPSRYKKKHERKKKTRGERARNRTRVKKLQKKMNEELPEDEEISAERLSECCAISLGSQQHLQSLARGTIQMMD